MVEINSKEKEREIFVKIFPEILYQALTEYRIDKLYL